MRHLLFATGRVVLARRAETLTQPAALGRQMHALVERFHPLFRSISGDGVRATLDVLAESIPLSVHEVPTGTQVLDWTVPKEWNIHDAAVADPDGRRVIDFTKSNLYVVGSSVPARTKLNLAGLRAHPHTLPDQPPGTIGAITFLGRNAERVDKIKYGLVLACAGDSAS